MKILASIRYLSFCFLLCSFSIFSNVTSRTGQVKFDINGDGTAEATLSEIGMGVGSNFLPSANLHVMGNSIVTGSLSVGGALQNSSSLNINGSFGQGFRTITSDEALLDNSLVFADSSSDNIKLMLPQSSSMTEGRVYQIKKTSIYNQVSVVGGGLIDGHFGILLESGSLGSLKVVCSSGNWSILSLNGGDLHWSPSSLNSELWLDSSQSSTLSVGSSSNVYQWDDISGNERHLSQATQALQPTFGRLINGFQTVEFDGASVMEYYSAGLSPSSSNTMIFAVIDSDQFNRYLIVFNAKHRLILGAGFFQNSSNGADKILTASGKNSEHLVSGFRNGNAASVAHNGNYTESPTGKDVTAVDFWRLGSSSNASGSLDASVGELIMFQYYDLSIRQKIEGYLAHKWGIDSDLPLDHPYKEIAP
jgi:hypothetical protein